MFADSAETVGTAGLPTPGGTPRQPFLGETRVPCGSNGVFYCGKELMDQVSNAAGSKSCCPVS